MTLKQWLMCCQVFPPDGRKALLDDILAKLSAGGPLWHRAKYPVQVSVGEVHVNGVEVWGPSAPFGICKGRRNHLNKVWMDALCVVIYPFGSRELPVH